MKHTHMPVTLDRKFEKFLGGPVEPPAERVHATIDKRSVITMNAKCYRELGKPPGAFLHFSRIDDTIAIEPASSLMLPGVFPFHANGTARYLYAASFTRHFRIDLDTTLRFISPDFRDGALQLKLSETVTIARTRRWQRKAKT